MKLADVGKSWLATRMGIVTETLRRMTIDKIRGIDRQEKELQEDQAKLDAQYKVRCRDMGSLHVPLPRKRAHSIFPQHQQADVPSRTHRTQLVHISPAAPKVFGCVVST